MALTEYKMGKTFRGVIEQGLTISQSPHGLKLSEPKKGPNVILILDDTGFGHLGCYGSPDQLPNIDKLAAEG